MSELPVLLLDLEEPKHTSDGFLLFLFPMSYIPTSLRQVKEPSLGLSVACLRARHIQDRCRDTTAKENAPLRLSRGPVCLMRTYQVRGSVSAATACLMHAHQAYAASICLFDLLSAVFRLLLPSGPLKKQGIKAPRDGAHEARVPDA